MKRKRQTWLRTSQGFPEWVGEVELEGHDVHLTQRYPSRFRWVARTRARFACLRPIAHLKLLWTSYGW